MDEQLLDLINNYLAGKSSPEETRQLQAWLDSFNSDLSLLASLSPQELRNIAGSMFAAITRALDAHPDEIVIPRKQ